MKAIELMPEPYNGLEVFCFNSTSKGLISEGGVRGGYVAMANIDEEVKKWETKKRSYVLEYCGTDHDWFYGEPSKLWGMWGGVLERKGEFFENFGEKKKIANDCFKRMKNLNCQTIEATFYAFPSL